MSQSDFSRIASFYDGRALVQRPAGDTLLEMARITPDDNVLDLGCGTGYLTKKVRGLTRGHVAGVDISPGMIEQAIQNADGLDIEFEAAGAESIDYRDKFDVIICNSTFQWFKSPERVLANCHRALREGGRIAVQAPAKENYCPAFINAVEAVSRAPETRDTFATFISPWFFYEAAEEYSALFEKREFTVHLSRIELTGEERTVDETMGIFESGAAAGYLNPECYGAPFPAGYADDFRRIVKDSFQSQAVESGRLRMDFHRLFLLAGKS